jgi:mannose-1-phosphate guanylyltransferase
MSVSVAYVLAAGLGTRLRPLTNARCKPLVEVCGTPLIAFTLRLLKDAGVSRVGINSHWLHPQLPATLGASFGSLALTFTHEPEVLGTGGGLRALVKAVPPPPDERVLVINADALIDVDLGAFVRAPDDALATLMLRSAPDVAAYGAIGTDDDDRITAFAGRIDPIGAVTRERMFCGVHLVHPRAFAILPDVALDNGVATGVASGINDDGYPRWLVSGELLRGFDSAGTFCDVGTPERLLEANLAVLDGSWVSTHLRPFADLARHAGRVFIGADARVDGELVGPALVANGARIEAGAIVERSVIGRGATVGAHARVRDSVLQSGAHVRGDVIRTIAWPGGELRVP